MITASSAAPDTGYTLRLTLMFAVPLRIQELQRRGGPTDTDLDWLRGSCPLPTPKRKPATSPSNFYDDVQGFVAELAAQYDDMLHRGEYPGHSAELFAGLANALAILAFAPGGVKLFDQHWEATV